MSHPDLPGNRRALAEGLRLHPEGARHLHGEEHACQFTLQLCDSLPSDTGGGGHRRFGPPGPRAPIQNHRTKLIHCGGCYGCVYT